MQVKSIAESSKLSAILSTFIKLPFVIEIFVLTIFECSFYTGLLYFLILDGNVTTLVALDYEAPPPATTCTLTVTANDGKMDSTTPGVLTLEITNWDEPPVFDMPLYKIITPEVTV